MTEQYLGNDQTIYIFNDGKEVVLTSDQFEEMVSENEKYQKVLKDNDSMQIEINTNEEQISDLETERDDCKRDIYRVKNVVDDIERYLRDHDTLYVDDGLSTLISQAQEI